MNNNQTLSTSGDRILFPSGTNLKDIRKTFVLDVNLMSPALVLRVQVVMYMQILYQRGYLLKI